MAKSSSRILTNHDEIRRWAEERGAKPVTVRATADDQQVGIIRLDFPGYSGGNSLEEIEWDEWFEKFDDSGLALIVQNETANGQKSNFNKLVSRENVGTSSDEQSSGSRSISASSKRKSSSRSAKKKSATRSSSRKKPSASEKPRTQKRTTGRSKGGSSGGRSAA